MSNKIVTVTGATGNIGAKLASHLLTEGFEVRVIGRSADRLQALVDQGAKAFIGDLQDTSFLTKAFTGSDVVFALIPPDYTAKSLREFYNIVGASIATAVEKSGVKKVLNLSSVGAQHSEGVGPIRGLYDQEQRLNKLAGVAVTHLRPAYFFENIYFSLPLIKGQNILGSPIAAATRFSQVATADIAKRAAELIADDVFSGQQVHELLGERDLTMPEIAAIIKAKTGRESLPYIEFPNDAARAAMIDSGLSADVADNFIELYEGINNKKIAPVVARNAASTSATSFEAFVEQIASAF